MQAEHGGDLAVFCQQYGFRQNEVLDFSSNLNWFLDEIDDATWLRLKAAAGVYGQAGAGADGVVTKIADLYAYDKNQVLATAGSIEAIYLTAQLFRQRRILIGEPGFVDYRRAFRKSETRAWDLAIENEAALQWAEVVIFGSPNNPNGQRYPLAEWRRRWPGKIWLVDETFVDFSKQPPSAAQDQVIIYRSFTKSWSIPGLRLGFLLCSNQSWMEELRWLQAPWSVSALAQAWAGERLNQTEKERVDRAIEHQIRERDRLMESLRGFSGLRVHDSDANFFLIELLQGSAAELWQSLAKKSLLTRKVDDFGNLTKDRFLRLTVRSFEDNENLIKGLRDYFDQ